MAITEADPGKSMKRLFQTARRTSLAVVALLLCLPVQAKTVLITGANSGIGLEFARQYAADGWQVIATHRRNGIPRTLAELSTEFDNVQVEFMDVTDHGSIDALASRLTGTPIDVLLNNAGIVGGLQDPAQKFGTLDYAVLNQFIQTNTVGPLKVAEAFFPHVRASEEKKIVGISTVAASIEFTSQGGPAAAGLSFRYAYGMSKAALNMAYAGLANDVGSDAVIVGLLHPGLVRVARTEQYGSNPRMQALMLDVDVAVRQMRDVIENLTPADSGGFFSHDGSTVPW